LSILHSSHNRSESMSMSDLALEPMHNAPNRPSVLSLAIKEKAALFAAYMPFLKNGGIFVPTNKAYRLGDEIYLILTLLDDPAKYPIAGKVAWVTPAGAGNNKSQGIGVHFPSDESGTRIRLRIEDALGAAIRSNRPTHTI